MRGCGRSARGGGDIDVVMWGLLVGCLAGHPGELCAYGIYRENCCLAAGGDEKCLVLSC